MLAGASDILGPECPMSTIAWFMREISKKTVRPSLPQKILLVCCPEAFLSTRSSTYPNYFVRWDLPLQIYKTQLILPNNLPLLLLCSPLCLCLICCLIRSKHIQVVQGTPQDKQQQKRCSKYSQKALLFAITTFVAYLGSSSSASSSTGNTAFRIAMAAFFIAISIDLISATRTPKWGCACLVYLSWFLLVLLSYLLLVSFHRDYCYAIILVPLLVLAAALLQCKLRPSVTQQNTTSDSGDQDLDTDDDADQDLENIFDWSAGIVNCGGLISMILGHYMYMVGPNHLKEASVIGFLFFFTVVLGLYLMMVTTVKNVALTPYVGHLTCLLNILLVCTLIATLIHGVWLSRNDSHV
ncbi:uncharacterized protein LOC112896260 isoform X2 [Panicum hallii]|uniref:uncharacterized protein LOC112896260 isoform X2 n=1 Tax=Panicum hallii TaxID=206008 RepID=UPI000DF4CFED|nr:uncharacterized protein LOC112896260 isoform X2 [Panicum hallii]